MTYGQLISLPDIAENDKVEKTWSTDYVLYCNGCKKNVTCYPIVWICSERCSKEECSDDEFIFDEKKELYKDENTILRCGICGALEGSLSSYRS